MTCFGESGRIGLVHMLRCANAVPGGQGGGVGRPICDVCDESGAVSAYVCKNRNVIVAAGVCQYLVLCRPSRVCVNLRLRCCFLVICNKRQVCWQITFVIKQNVTK